MRSKPSFWDIALTTLTVVATFVVLSARTGQETVAGVTAPAPIAVPTVEVGSGQPEPFLKLDMYPDPERGWNLRVETENFVLLPEHEGQNDGTLAAGYAYVSVDGGPATRLYSSWLHMPDMPDGTHTLEISLRNPNFEAYTYGGEPVLVRYEATMKADAVDMKTLQS